MKPKMIPGICLIIILCFVNVYGQSEGDSCKINNKNGECILINDCEEAVQNIRKNIPIQRCGFRGKIPIVCCPPELRTITLQKCNEYYSPQSDKEQTFHTVAVGGKPAEVKEFAHMVALGFTGDNDIEWLCGGSLISTNYVLTAAHCLFAQQYGAVKKALMGTVNLRNQTAGGLPQMFDIKTIIKHPDYKRRNKYHDIGLLELNGHVEINDYVKPICLHTSFEIYNPDFIATGWGKTEYNGKTSNDLIKVELMPYNNSYCNEQYADVPNLSNGIVEENQLCAGSRDLVKAQDTCQGDSGGPLHYVQGNKVFLVGITSFGRACGLIHTPGVYTRVSNYLPWIENIIWN